MKSEKTTRRRMKNRPSLRTNIILIVVCTALAVGITALVLYLCGL